MCICKSQQHQHNSLAYFDPYGIKRECLVFLIIKSTKSTSMIAHQLQNLTCSDVSFFVIFDDNINIHLKLQRKKLLSCIIYEIISCALFCFVFVHFCMCTTVCGKFLEVIHSIQLNTLYMAFSMKSFHQILTMNYAMIQTQYTSLI